MSEYSGYDMENMRERYGLTGERLLSLKEERLLPEPYGEYFRKNAVFILEGTYEDLLPDKYESSYTNPVFCAKLFGKEMGQLLSFLSYELTSLIPFRAEKDRRLEDITILREVFLEIYTAFLAASDDPSALSTDIRNILVSFITDYTDVTVADRIRELVDPSMDFAKRIIMEEDLSDVSYLDLFGEYITDDTRKLAAFIASLPEDDIEAMAVTFRDGYIRGFEAIGKDISTKKTVNIRYPLGFERIVRAAILAFREAGLEAAIFRRGLHAAVRGGLSRTGFSGEPVNEQMDYDHREDEALFLDRAYMERKLEIVENTWEKVKDLASVFAGPAVMERFGMKEFIPVNHEESFRLSEKQTSLKNELASRQAVIENRFIPSEERTFTMIAFPVPQIGEAFPEIFRRVIDINTLPNQKYQAMQQCIIHELEKGRTVEIKGKDGNRTDIRIRLNDKIDINKETIFENCVADVNIPAGEVFTTPRLEGTDGVLHVSRVYIHGLVFRDLSFKFENGFVTGYSCGNFETEEENSRYIEENILYHHKSLPMGEFAIGTNTTAYVMAKKYGIFDKLPILIAEKTGPHFALGDTCYKREEDIDVFNPDGRRIIARDNEHTEKYRKSDPEKAYFNCHTDITLPYEELSEISAVDASGNHYPIIKDGRFTVKGAEELNVPLDECLPG